MALIVNVKWQPSMPCNSRKKLINELLSSCNIDTDVFEITESIYEKQSGFLVLSYEVLSLEFDEPEDEVAFRLKLHEDLQEIFV